MEQALVTSVDKSLQDLLEGLLTPTRKEAAQELGKLSASSERIVGTLVAASESDREASVRGVAAEALLAPAHREVMEQNPDLVRKLAVAQKEQVEAERKKLEWQRVYYCDTCRTLDEGQHPDETCAKCGSKLAFATLIAVKKFNAPRMAYLALWAALGSLGWALSVVWEPMRFLIIPSGLVLGSYALIAA